MARMTKTEDDLVTVTSHIDAVEANFDSINTKLDKLDNILTLMEAFNRWRLLVDKSLLDNTRSVRELTPRVSKCI